jgi:hypothetical protein
VDYQCSSEWLEQLQDGDSKKEEQHRKVTCFLVYDSFIMFSLTLKCMIVSLAFAGPYCSLFSYSMHT